MNPAKILLAVLIPFMLTACGTIKEMKLKNIGIAFEKSSKDYIQLVRWHEFENAESTFVSPSLREEYRKRILAAGDVRITDYRVKSMGCDPVKGEGTAKVELDYYRPPSVRVHTVEDFQKWSYEGEESSMSWQLKTLLPEFK